MDGVDKHGPEWVIHLPIDADSLPSAKLMAEVIVGLLEGQAPQIVGLLAEVSRANDRGRRTPVFCGRRLADGSRCPMPNQHQGPCMPRQAEHDGWTVIA